MKILRVIVNYSYTTHSTKAFDTKMFVQWTFEAKGQNSNGHLKLRGKMRNGHVYLMRPMDKSLPPANQLAVN